MTEKRFVVEKYSVRDMSIDEKYANSSYHIGDKGIAQSLCDLLNGLNDENEQLKFALIQEQEVSKELKSQLDTMIDIFNDSGLDYYISDELEEILNE